MWTDLWDARVADNMAHIELSRDRDLILVAPATADFLAKVAHGLADDLLVDAVPGAPLPADGRAGDERRDVGQPGDAAQRARAARGRRALRRARRRATRPAAKSAWAACSSRTQIVAEVEALFQPKRLAGKRVLVTAGPTEEPIDPVRGITNSSSGKMGYAVARAAREAGAEVTLVSGPVALADAGGRGARRRAQRRARCSTR